MAIIGDFCLAKVNMYYNGHYEGYYKFRPVLIIGEQGKNYFKCLSITSKLKTKKSMSRIDIYTNYNFDKHSQIILDSIILLDKRNIIKILAHCRPEDMGYILERHNEEIKERK